MSNRGVVNAKIKGTMLGYEDHGLLSCMIYLEYDGAGQGFGGYAFDDYNPDDKERHGVAFGMEFIARLLKAVGVEKWESLPGTYVRVDQEHTKAHRIGHIIEDKWFDPEDLRREFFDE